MIIKALKHHHRGEVLKLLLSDLPSNLFLVDLLFQRGINSSSYEHWLGVFQEKKIVAISVSFGSVSKSQKSRLIVAFGNPKACTRLGQQESSQGGTEMIIGDRTSSDALYTQWRQSAQLVYDQRLYVCHAVPNQETIPIRFATTKDIDIIYQYSAQMVIEDLKYDPRILHPQRFHTSIQSKIERNKCIVAEHNGEICYIIDIGTHFRLGCQLGGTFVPPKFRGKGFSTKATAAVCTLMLSSCDCVTLHVHEQNIPAIRCYERVGFLASTPFRLISFLGTNHAQ
ncbi:MAG: hypothetical protein CL916_05430 [Deltaproteobacteria bacterium]|nr:hypothetical protein [Deltaproteobacteria bacterium]